MECMLITKMFYSLRVKIIVLILLLIECMIITKCFIYYEIKVTVLLLLILILNQLDRKETFLKYKKKNRKIVKI